MRYSLQDLRAFAVRNRVDITFHVRATKAAWMVNHRGLVARPLIGDSTVCGVEQTLAQADEFVLEGENVPRQHLTPTQFIEMMEARAAGTSREQGTP